MIGANPCQRNRITLYAVYGFTLIELLVTLAILGAMASLTVPTAQIIRQRSNEQELRLALREIRKAIDAYQRASEEGRISKNPGSNGYPKNLDILVDGVLDERDPKHTKIFFLRKIPREPMNTNSALTNAETWGKRSYASEADDPQEGDDIYDVYSTSTQTGLNGIPYNKW